MRYLAMILACTALLGGCGVETATTAASVAAAKAKEVEEAKKTEAKVVEQFDAANKTEQQKTQDAADSAGR